MVPFLGGLVGFGFALIDPELERAIDIPAFWQYTPTTASAVLAAIVGAVAALTGFVITVTVLGVQMATGTFSARYMRLWYRDRMLKVLLAVLVGTLVLSLRLLQSIGSTSAPNLGVTVAGFLVVVALLLFLIYFNRFIHRMRPVAVAALVADGGRRAFLDATADAGRGSLPAGSLERAVPLIPNKRPGVIQAIHTDGLVRWAQQHDCLLVFPHAVGDFVDAGATLVEVVDAHDAAIGDGDKLYDMVALGIERTLEQDTGFAIRILVDVAIRALSPAVNDPTTAVQTLNHLGPLLRVISESAEGTSVWVDGSGQPRLVMRTRRFEDYLALGVTEIREFGAPSVQVLRRLRAMLDDLYADAPQEHRAAIADELARLDATAAASFGSSVDLDRARVADRQGLGGPSVQPFVGQSPAPPERPLERLTP